ncbi:hypothetical protein CP10139811_0232 [Chlamydia ibidis]|uniref:Transmembrane protein n=2 Tax=Chlamydia ibidis TaxID=1405396 RepID=S7J252_9CHLA|nr:hypothetical protein [Chlamydia ibidis]EPP34303.1 hypothetical protein CP10139811_0232 [Chlamydia ibidis]EQM62653.1 hypothetical protein H359_0678 [Chlamydia ibidis 10-1398/6]
MLSELHKEYCVSVVSALGFESLLEYEVKPESMKSISNISRIIGAIISAFLGLSFFICGIASCAIGTVSAIIIAGLGSLVFGLGLMGLSVLWSKLAFESIRGYHQLMTF